ncbi:Gfo/Idh/MocA family oxidoreductase [Selenomonas timonae]|uniref:Gfo/Idh/MocA family oxidoreductase n=1 Tax=Selenomonas timonae TaxID=2754044 RepID=A0A7G7VJM9_9FIRM|nr:Gfo/Idh/MocA family oxidoreductase [Selenomonas timonae]QNH54322.1 Gfo/Idh/MocA family oxidoreductase [Selenomonas timonae]
MKIAVVGTGMIAREALIALRQLEGIEVVTICARPHSREKARVLAQEFGVPQVATDYGAMLAAHEADFVYIGIVNSAHFDYARQAIAAGWHVILEKPFTSTLAEAEELIARARAAHCYLFEAVTPLFLPNYVGILETLPQLGLIRLVQANYSKYSSRYDRYLARDVAPAFDPSLSGGALYDLNVYNLELIVSLFGRPKSAAYTANVGFNGIDTSGVMTMRYDGFVATAAAAKDSSSPSFFMIQGESGWIRADGEVNALSSFTVGLRGREPETYELNRHEHRMVHEFEAMRDIFARKDYMSVEEGLQISRTVMAVMEKARLMAGIQFRAD